MDFTLTAVYSDKTPYDLWQESEGIPIVRGHCVEDLTAIPVAPWKRTGGGPTFRTIGCAIQLLREREKTKQHRHSSHTIYHAFRGAGRTTVGNNVLEWNQGDCFIVPSWEWHAHENPVRNEAILFSITDRPLKESLGFYWEERRPDQ